LADEKKISREITEKIMKVTAVIAIN